MDVAGAGRCVDNEIVELAPVGLGDELLEGVAGHGAAPYGGLLGLDKESDGQNLDAPLLGGHNQLAVAHHLAHGLVFLKVKHRGDGRTEDVGIKQSHAVAKLGKGHGEVGRHGALAHAALAGGNGDDLTLIIDHWPLTIVGCRLAVVFPVVNGDADLRLFGGKGVDGCFGSLDHGLLKRVGILRKDYAERHLHAVNAQIVVNHSGLHDVLAGAGVLNLREGIEY